MSVLVNEKAIVTDLGYTDEAARLSEAITDRLETVGISKSSGATVGLISLGSDSDAVPIKVDNMVLSLLRHILDTLAQGYAVTLIPSRTELSEWQAAEFLDISRPYLRELLKNSEIPYRVREGSYLIRFEALYEYKSKLDQESEVLLKECIEEAQAEGYYDYEHLESLGLDSESMMLTRSEIVG